MVEPTRVYTLVELGVFISAVCTSIGTLAIGIITAWKTVNKVNEQTNKLDVQYELIKTVEHNTNSRATVQDSRIMDLLTEVKQLTNHIADLDTTRVELAGEVKLGLADDKIAAASLLATAASAAADLLKTTAFDAAVGVQDTAAQTVSDKEKADTVVPIGDVKSLIIKP